MYSTTNSKKGIIDFLWDWANLHGNWGKYLVHNIVTTEEALSEDERKKVFDYFIDSLRPAEKRLLPTITFSKPQYSPTDKTIELVTLKDVTGVNRLANGQIIHFSKNITVIYGENGTGKTGYGRILKSLGFGYDNNARILNNVFERKQTKSAKISFKVNDLLKEHTWTEESSDQDLSNISVFNNDSVPLSLSDRRLIVTPIGFNLFSLVSTELTELAKILQTKIASYSTSLNWQANLHRDTPQTIYIGSLSAKSDIQKLKEISTFSEEHQNLLVDKEKQNGQLNKELIISKISTITNQLQEIVDIISKITFAQTNFTLKVWQRQIDCNENITRLTAETSEGIKEIAEKNGIQLYNTQEFKTFISAAESYIKILDRPNYPEINNLCVYCNQPLETLAKELLDSYKRLLNDTTQDDLKKFRNEKEQLIATIQKVETKLKFVQATFGLDEESNVVQPIEIDSYNNKIDALKSKFVAGAITKQDTFNFAYDEYLKFLNTKKIELEKNKSEKSDLLRDLEASERKLRAEIAELKDRKTLSEKIDEIKTVINNYKIINLLNSKANEFNTASLSRKTSEAREELLTQDFQNIFKKELEALRKGHIQVDLNFGTDRGYSKLSQRIKNYNLRDILSEGEQKAMALAEFLTELQLDNIKAPVIFDDPVNSLDTQMIDSVAKRFIELSKSRQVVVFTHSILLLNSFIQQSELEPNKKSVKFNFYSVSNNYGETGIVADAEELNSFTYYKNKLDELLKQQNRTEPEHVLAARGYGYLRSAIEICVEEDVFKHTIKRYRKGVAFPALLRVSGDKIDEHKIHLNDIYEKCCVSIDGHSSPQEIHVEPTINGLQQDYEQFKNIRKNFTSSK